MDSSRRTFHEHYSESMKPKKSDSDLDAEMRGREMAADPMLEYFRQKEREKQGQSNTKPVYKGSFPPNRYNIRPGYRWDGVDRSNGFENRLLEKEGAKKAREEDEYRWATRDL